MEARSWQKHTLLWGKMKGILKIRKNRYHCRRLLPTRGNLTFYRLRRWNLPQPARSLQYLGEKVRLVNVRSICSRQRKECTCSMYGQRVLKTYRSGHWIYKFRYGQYSSRCGVICGNAAENRSVLSWRLLMKVSNTEAEHCPSNLSRRRSEEKETTFSLVCTQIVS